MMAIIIIILPTPKLPKLTYDDKNDLGNTLEKSLGLSVILLSIFSFNSIASISLIFS
jgi:hypothetical protein